MVFSGLPEAIASFNGVTMSNGPPINGRPSFTIAFQVPPGQPRQRYTLWYAPVERMWVLGLTSIAGQRAEGFLCASGDFEDPTLFRSPWVYYDAGSKQWAPQQAVTCQRSREKPQAMPV